MEIKPTYCSFEQGLLLNEKKCDLSSEGNWWILAKDHDKNYKKGLPYDKDKIFFAGNDHEYNVKVQIDEDTEHQVYHILSCPEQWQIIEWLRIKHNIHIDLACYYNPQKFDKMFYEVGISNKQNGYEGLMQNASNRINIDWTKEPSKYWLFNSPQEAYSAAIDYVLNNLI